MRSPGAGECRGAGRATRAAPRPLSPAPGAALPFSAARLCLLVLKPQRLPAEGCGGACPAVTATAQTQRGPPRLGAPGASPLLGTCLQPGLPPCQLGCHPALPPRQVWPPFASPCSSRRGFFLRPRQRCLFASRREEPLGFVLSLLHLPGERSSVQDGEAFPFQCDAARKMGTPGRAASAQEMPLPLPFFSSPWHRHFGSNAPFAAVLALPSPWKEKWEREVCVCVCVRKQLLHLLSSRQRTCPHLPCVSLPLGACWQHLSHFTLLPGDASERDLSWP